MDDAGEAHLRRSPGLDGRGRYGGGTGVSMTIEDTETGDRLAALAARLPRAVRFIVVGCIGLLTDLCVFTAIVVHAPHPLVVRLLSLGLATLVTWRLNRALTFAPRKSIGSPENARSGCA